MPYRRKKLTFAISSLDEFLSKSFKSLMRYRRNHSNNIIIIIIIIIIYTVCSVPQGSVLGPLLFIVYTADLADIVEKQGVSLHAFIDDTQVYLHFVAPIRRQLPPNWNDALQMSATGCQQTDWSSIRTRLSYSGSDRDTAFPARLLSSSTATRPDSIAARDHVRLLGVTLSSCLSLDRYVSTVSAFGFWLRQLRRYRRSLDTESAVTLVHAFVTSRIDYCKVCGRIFAASRVSRSSSFLEC